MNPQDYIGKLVVVPHVEHNWLTGADHHSSLGVRVRALAVGEWLRGTVEVKWDALDNRLTYQGAGKILVGDEVAFRMSEIENTSDKEDSGSAGCHYVSY